MDHHEDNVLVIMGVAEVAEYLEYETGKPWTPKKVAKYLARARERGNPEGSFPEPDIQLRCGSIWLQETIDGYVQQKGA